MKVRYSYRLRLSAQSERLLLAEDGRCRWIWNQCVALDRDARQAARETGEKPAYEPSGGLDRRLTAWRTEHEWLAAGSVVAQQQTIRDFCEARRDGIQIRARGGRRGRPRFKSRRRALSSLNYTLRGFALRDGRLVLAGGVVLRPVWSRELPGEPSSVRVSRDTLGRWFVSLVVERQVEPLPETGRPVGIDFGLKAVATTSAGPVFDLPHEHHGDRAARALLRYERQMARRRRPRGQAASKGCQTAKKRVAQIKAKVAAKRQDQARKWAVNLVRSFDRIAAEDLSAAFMLKNPRLARTAADARIAAAKAALQDAAVKHGRQLVWVNPAYTTMDCSACGSRAKTRLPLSQRTYMCEVCGHAANRDQNAASVMLARAGFDPAGADRVRREDRFGALAA
ncbi:MAG: RNA-guided endonuclease InsQ/TnpB family protein [Solirubrobacteraceae bacterium]